MTRVREETTTSRHPEGVADRPRFHGRRDHGPAGIVFEAKFLVLGSIPFVFLVELEVAMALGVLLVTIIVRSVLVTALNLDLGAKIWWPSKLDHERLGCRRGGERNRRRGRRSAGRSVPPVRPRNPPAHARLA